jgi:hypothetical protein
MTPRERAARLTELGTWVAWLVYEYNLESQLNECWYLHADVVDYLTALYLSWVRTYTPPADGRSPERFAEADWLFRFFSFESRLATRACTQAHAERPRIPWTFNPLVMRVVLANSTWANGASGNPAAVEMVRYRQRQQASG